MKTFVLWACLLGAVSCGDFSDELKCPGNPSSTKFSLKSYRNQTGHWTAQVQLEHTDVEEDAAVWDVNIDHTFAPRCDGSAAVILTATVTVPPSKHFLPKPQPQKRLPEGYEKLSKNKYFKFYPEPSTWVKARDICEKDGARMAVMYSGIELMFVSAIWNSSSEWAFIGTYGSDEEEKIVPIFNETLPKARYDLWLKGDPNGGTNENCRVLFRNGLLGYYFCTGPLPFVCKLEF